MGPPKPPVPHVAPIYRLTATALGAGMWFWVSVSSKTIQSYIIDIVEIGFRFIAMPFTNGY